MIAIGQTIVVDGNVNGDLLAFGSTVTVRGNVTGDLICTYAVASDQGLIDTNDTK